MMIQLQNTFIVETFEHLEIRSYLKVNELNEPLSEMPRGYSKNQQNSD